MNLSKNISKYSTKVNACPLCKNKTYEVYSKYYPNRYSDEFSKITKVSENILLKKFNQVKCKKCELIYKKLWFKDSFLKNIYSKIVPIHPTGWDVNSNKFSKKFLKKQIRYYKTILNNKKFQSQDEINKYKRIILSIVGAIHTKNEINRKKILEFEKDINTNKIKKIIKNENKIANLISKPKPFSRFTKVGNEEIFNLIIKKIGKITSYSEIGCPLWGMINISKKRGLKNYFFKSDERYFWGKNCSKNGINCIEKLDNKTTIVNLNKFNKKIDYIGVYNYIDHISDLSNFLKKLFSISRSVGIMFENEKRGYPIQHNFGLSDKNLEYISKSYNKKLWKFDKKIISPKSCFYLLY